MVHEQKFKDLLSSTCQVGVERIVLDLESEVMGGLGSIPTGDNILSLDFFHIVKPRCQYWHYCQFRLICEKLVYFNCVTWFGVNSDWQLRSGLTTMV